MAATLAGDNFKCIFMNEVDRIQFWFTLKFVPRSLIDSNPVLIPVMALRLFGANVDTDHWRIYAALEGDELKGQLLATSVL